VSPSLLAELASAMPDTDDQSPPKPVAAPPEEQPVEEDFSKLFAESERSPKARRLAVGDVVSAKVIAIGSTAVFVAIGDKSEAALDPAEFRDAETGEIRVAVGDEIEATVVDDGGRSGAPVLRRTMGRGGNIAAELEQAFEHGLPIEGLVTAEIKGGFDVQIGKTRAFCPGSQIDMRRGGERIAASEYIGQRFEFRVTKLEQGGRNVVVSRRAVLEEEAASAAERTWERIEVGAVLEGTVTSVRDFGAFVDLGGVEGMIHVSELGYSRVAHPSEALSVGQTVRAQVIKVGETTDSRGRRQVGLSLKALAEDPWTTLKQQFPVGSTVPGTVRRLEAFGAFVEIAPGVEGLVHVSKITTERRLSHPRQALEVGQSIEVTILSIDAKQRRISLSMVERAKSERDAQERAERAEEQRVMTELNQPKSLGTLGDLLAAANAKKK
jgi:small subunit ribosomal protein S1